MMVVMVFIWMKKKIVTIFKVVVIQNFSLKIELQIDNIDFFSLVVFKIFEQIFFSLHSSQDSIVSIENLYIFNK